MASLSVTTLKRKKLARASIPMFEKVKLERVLGLSVSGSSALAADPENGLIAYPAGCVIVLYSSQKNRQGHIINVSKKTITCLSFCPAGRYLATGESGHQPRVRVWDTLNDNTQISDLNDHKFGIVAVAFSPNGSYLVSVGNQHDMTVNVWNWRNNVKLACGKVSCKALSLSFGESGNYFVTAGVRHVKFWYMERSKGTKDAIPLQGRSAILADYRNNNFCDVACGRGETSASTFCITQSGLLCEFNDRRILEKWVELRVRFAASLTLGSNFLFIGCSDGIVRIFTASKLSFVATLPLPHSLGIDVASATLNAPVGDRYPDVVALCFEPKFFRLACIYSDHSLYQWDVEDFKHIGKATSFLYHSGCVWSVETTSIEDASNSCIPADTFITSGSDDTIRIWNLDTNMLSSKPFRRNIFSQDLLKILYVDPEHQFLCAGENSSEKSDSEHKNGVRTIKVSPDGLHLASGDRNGNLRIFRLTDSVLIREIEAHDSEVLTLEYSSRSTGFNLLVSGSRDRMIHILSVNDNYEPLLSIEGHSAAVIAAKFALIQNELTLLSCSCDKLILFHKLSFEPEPGYTRTHSIASQMTIYDLDLDCSSRYIFTACQDRQIRVYDLRDGKHKKSFKASTSDDGTLVKLTLDETGHFVTTAGSDKNMGIFNCKSGECVSVMFGHSEVVTAVRFSRDYRRIISVSADGCIFVWRLSTDFTNKLINLSQNKLARQQSSLTDDMLSTTDDDQSVTDDGVSKENRLSSQLLTRTASRESASEIAGAPIAAAIAPHANLPTKNSGRSRWDHSGSAASFQFISSVNLRDESNAGLSVSSSAFSIRDEMFAESSNLEAVKQKFIADQIEKENQQAFMGKVDTRRYLTSSNFGSLANVKLVGDDDTTQTPMSNSVIFYPDASNDIANERSRLTKFSSFEVKERVQETGRLRSYGRSDTYGNDASDEDDASSGNLQNDNNGRFADDESIGVKPFNQFDPEDTINTSFERNGSARLSITSKYLQKNKLKVDSSCLTSPSNVLTEVATSTEKTAAAQDAPIIRQRAKWAPQNRVEINIMKSTPTPPTLNRPEDRLALIKNPGNCDNESPQTLWSYKNKTVVKSESTPLKAVVDPKTVSRAKALSELAKVRERRQSMPSYISGSSSGNISETALKRDLLNSRSSLLSSTSTMTTSRSILNENQRRFGAGRTTNAAATVAVHEKSAQNAAGRLAASCSMSSLAYSNDSATTDTSETMQKMSALREKLRKSQENLSRTVALDQEEQSELTKNLPSSNFNANRSKSFGNLSQMQTSSIRRDSDDKTPTKEDQSNLRSTKDIMQSTSNLSPHLNRSLANTLNELSKLSQSDLTNIVDKTSVTNPDSGSFYSSTSLPRYRKATPSGVQKKLFQVKARIATGSAGSHVNGASSQNLNNANRSYSSYMSQPNMTPHRHTSGVDPASFKNAFNASSAGSHSIDIRRSPSDMISAGQRASMNMSSTPVRIRNDGSSPIPNPRRSNYLARLLAEDQNGLGQQQGSSSDRSSSRVESGVAPEIFEGAHFDKMSNHCRESCSQFRTTLDKILHSYHMVASDNDLSETERASLLSILTSELNEAARRLHQTLNSGSSRQKSDEAAPAPGTQLLTGSLRNVLMAGGDANAADAALQQYTDMLVTMIQQKMQK